MSHFSQVSAEVSAFLSNPDLSEEKLSVAARSVSARILKVATKDRDAEWQRVNSYLADVLKDAHVLYSKLARLQGDFAGSEANRLEEISEKVLDLGEEMSRFMKDFHTGRADMVGDTAFGGSDGDSAGAPDGTPPPMVPSEFESGGGEAKEEGGERPEEDYETEIRLDEEGEFSEFDEEGGEAA